MHNSDNSFNSMNSHLYREITKVTYIVANS